MAGEAEVLNGDAAFPEGPFWADSGPWESAPIVGKVYHLAAGGALTPLADDLHYANGVHSQPTASSSTSTSPRPGG